MEAIFDYASTHHGVVSRAELYALGLTKNQVNHLIRMGRLTRVSPGTFVIAGSPESWHRRARVASLAVDGLVSHRAAAALHGIDGFNLRQIEVTVPKDRRPRGTTELVHRSTQMHLADPIVVEAIPVTGLARTVLDLAAVLSYTRFERVIDAVIRQELCDWLDLYEVLVLHSMKGRNGCGPLRALLDVRYGDTRVPDSAFNRLVGQLLDRAGLPSANYEYEIADHRGRFIGRVDLAYPRQRLAIELDSVRWHLNRESFEKDPRRKNRLMLAGWTVLTFTWADYVDRPAELIRSVSTALRRAA